MQGPLTVVGPAKTQKSGTADSQTRGFSHSFSRLWSGSTQSPKATDPKTVVPGSGVTHCLASWGTPSPSVREDWQVSLC